MLTLARRYAHLGPDDWGPLFHRALQSRIMDWHRRAKVRSRWRVWLGRDSDEREDPLERQPGAATDGPQAGASRAELHAALERALEALPLRQQ